MGYGQKENVINVTQEKDLPPKAENPKPNTRYNYYQNGNLKSSRWTNEKSVPVLSKHYTNHGNAKKHPVVPHYHNWGWVIGQWTELREQIEGEEE